MYFAIKAFPYECKYSDSYREVVISFFDTNDEQSEKAYEIADNLPLLWDDIAKEQLGVSYVRA